MIATRFAKRNIRRSPFQALAASMAMFSAFFALLVFLLLAAGSQAVLRYYESKPQVIAFFKEGTTGQDVTKIQEALEQTGKVAETKYVTKEEALQIYRRISEDKPDLVEAVTANILPASLEVSTISPEDLGLVEEILKKEPVVEDVLLPKDVVDRITTGAKAIRLIGGAVVGYLVLFATLQVLMIISFKIRLKREEIETMRLLGASPGFIRTPFILEGIFYGIVGATLSWAVIYGILLVIEPLGKVEEVSLLPVNPLLMLAILGSEIVIAVIVGSIGAYGAVRRYLRI